METRAATAEEFETWFRTVERAFAYDPDAEAVERERPLFEPARSLVVHDDGRAVATAGAYSLQMAVPGGVRPVAGVTAVSVAPTHRRRGILTDLMRRQLTDVAEAGDEALAALWASEPGIYGRFGYGLAAWTAGVDVPTRHAAFARAERPARRIREVDVAALPGLAGDVYDQWHRNRPGSYARDARWWARRLADPPGDRHGASPLRAAVAEGEGHIEGYAVFSVKAEWGQNGPDGVLTVREVVAAEPAAEAALWRFLLDHDLVATVTCWNLPVDTALLHLLLDPRRAAVKVKDNLWVRVVDPARALRERSYAAAASAVVEVVDAFGPWASGRWSLDVTPHGAAVQPTTASADVTLGAGELGAVVLGGTSLTSLAAAGRVDEHRAGAVRQLDAVLRWPVVPWCQEVF